ncbi:hypothetical protein F5I97DRAFT_1830626 [Phlebopus sp. FC_14]|nr:hypothetical protein F5I97DRAFT_1830626 [Phlebopus sp. FC_14]
MTYLPPSTGGSPGSSPAVTLNPSPRTSTTTDFLHEVSDGVQMFLPFVQSAADAIPIAGGPLKAIIGGLLNVLQTVDRITQNKAGVESIRLRLRTLYWDFSLASPASDIAEQRARECLFGVLVTVSDKLQRLHECASCGYVSVAQDISRCLMDIDAALQEYMVSCQLRNQASLAQIQTSQSQIHQSQTQMHAMQCDILDSIRAIHQTLDMQSFVQTSTRPTSSTLMPGIVTLVDATGREHQLLKDQCTSFQCTPDEALVQKWYISQHQFDFYIDGGAYITELTQESDEWSQIETGTKTIMRVIKQEIDLELSHASSPWTYRASFGCPTCLKEYMYMLGNSKTNIDERMAPTKEQMLLCNFITKKYMLLFAKGSSQPYKLKAFCGPKNDSIEKDVDSQDVSKQS